MMRTLVLLVLCVASGSLHAQTTALLLFGGSDHKTFLGCLNCGAYASTSVCNQYGSHGSRYAPESIWNAYGPFGSRYSADSPWNKYASTPPVIVDKDGGFYGYFTANRYHDKRTRIGALVSLTDVGAESDEDLADLSSRFCGRD